ncbi:MULTISPECIES: DUF1493 family protein [Yersinia]|uniref:DUF1493 domain-containing protein n=1 Tax=Yersinia bercovieri TaxID=634 RepID=A0A2G4U605_YERBE|nr:MULTISPECIES: DUF1493 family protein [Yersinia]MDN0103453.1 DUF1493 family protein [Yersinia bercovieri]PHZ28718.1 DUF1493 domain-containing protein [Yersinia bercovieri]QDW32703.1 DUF1493 family protein [Yersinia sp. KBS0713]QKJ08892.1 DUF1493 family protein [Yersinia bercovieri ATCC 43970]CNI29091.1 putative phage-associated acyl carrier protein [Yersinia bercovieri]
MNTHEAVLQFVKDELRCCQLQIDSSLSTGEHQTVPEDIYELMDKYSEKFNVDCSKIYWRRYFPQVVFPFLPNSILHERLKSDRHKPEPLTVHMLIESAKASRWLYD